MYGGGKFSSNKTNILVFLSTLAVKGDEIRLSKVDALCAENTLHGLSGAGVVQTCHTYFTFF